MKEESPYIRKIENELLESDPQHIHDFPKLAHSNAGSGNASGLYEPLTKKARTTNNSILGCKTH